MENLVTAQYPPSFDPRGLRILVTGHTGFKGAWLCESLLQAGAQVAGLALPPTDAESLHAALRHGERLEQNIYADIRDISALHTAIAATAPDVVFHLAAQALVRRSYRDPLATWNTNVQGTLNVLEALRGLDRECTALVVTSDKVYRNREWEFAYREGDELGGHDPYSASKAACELAVDSWRASFASDSGIRVVTARAGNVVGPGDFAEDRLVPDCYRAWNRGAAVELRNPASTRPWQHVLEPLSGYLALAAHARSDRPTINTCNFGPGAQGDRSVSALVNQLATRGAGRNWVVTGKHQPHEARSLALSIDRARHVLGWKPLLSFEETLTWIDQGYSAPFAELGGVVQHQITEYEARKQAAS